MIQTSALTKRFGDFVAVDHLDLRISAGEIFGFLGANGAGKTTSIRMLCGLLRPSSGEARVNGFDVAHDSERVKRSLGYMSQRFSLYNDLKAIENLQFYAGIYRVPFSVALDSTLPLIRLFGLEPSLKALTASLPVGFKQRLSLVCALVHDPPLVFLDEPTSGVDPKARREFWEVINTLAGQGKTVIVSTHFMDEAEYCHRVVVMREGKAVALGRPSELKRQYEVDSMQELFIQIVGEVSA
ncbi:MAG: ABC transporter ATP-binding protein [Candidatus Cloacimonetes bacterium]|nr:ABC transporter ATP-binding protein [Candidatus Cloacimonadota bacterium]HOH79721.1 ABC transporter ATP-binding protein [Candidatus Cloacimonadota bacterium]